MLTIDYDRLGLLAGDRLLDLGCGAGRHSYQALRMGADVVALDQNVDDLAGIDEMVEAMASEGEIVRPAEPVTLKADALDVPFPDGHFDRVVASEILEHIPDDRAVIAEIARVVRPGGTVAVSVPRRWTEQLCWKLSDAYHEVEGGHIRIYRGSELQQLITDAGLVPLGRHHAHALHSPYWWLKCAVGVDEADHPLVRAYHRLLVWDMMSRPWLTRAAERLLDPVLGKSVVLYFGKPAPAAASAAA